jgi:spermidine synthase
MNRRRNLAPLLMALSGAAALAYETVWMRQLTRAFGVTVYAVAGLVALYMGGLALGAALAARRRAAADWLRLYGVLEAAAGAAALAASWWLSRLPALVAAWPGDGPLPMAARLLLAAPALLPPTILLGATLPVLARDGGDPALLYGANTLGALAGLAAAAFWSIGTFGETATLVWAAAANFAAAAGALWLSRRSVVKPAGAEGGGEAGPASAVPLFVVSGFCALGCEVLWSRQLVPLLGNSTYAFALILGVYLAGLGLGSCLRVDAGRPWAGFSALLGALGSTIAMSAAATRFMGLRLDSSAFLYTPLRRLEDFFLVAMEAVVLVFPTAFVLGLLFPAALRVAGTDRGAVGRLYAWNTAGGIAGSLFCGFAGITLFGAHRSLLGLAALAAAASAAAALRERRRAVWGAAAGFAALSAVCAAYAPSDPSAEVLMARLADEWKAEARLLFRDESPAATIIGVERPGIRSLYVDGIATSGKGALGEFMALLPNVAAKTGGSTLVVCFGAGNAFRAASLLGPTDVVELIGDVVKRMPVFQEDAAAHLESPRNRIFVEDGRNFLLRPGDRRYDAVVVDGTPPLYSAGAVNLYTRQFHELARARLAPGGVFALWLPTFSFESDYWMILRAFCDAFPHARVWDRPGLTGFLVLGSEQPLEWPRGELDRRLKKRAKSLPWKGLDEAWIRSGFWLPEADLRAHAAAYPPLTDDRPVVEFPLPRFWRREPIVPTTEFLKKALQASN